MKSLIVFTLVASLCALALSEESCESNVVSACSSSVFGANNICNARFGGIDDVEHPLQVHINLHLNKSYEYLLLATHFNSFQKNRPGFKNLYQGLSDRSFDDTIDMIKQITRRGGVVNFNARHKTTTLSAQKPAILELDELQSLAFALDNEKQLAEGATHVHSVATHTTHPVNVTHPNHNNKKHDPEMAHYIEEKFLKQHAETVRKISGYANDLVKLLKVEDPSLAVYLFDEYLQKQ